MRKLYAKILKRGNEAEFKSAYVSKMEEIMANYELPSFLEGVIDRDNFKKWLDRRAKSHYKRDKKYFGNKFPEYIQPKDYKQAIYSAVIFSKGKCFYTNEKLRWDLINKFDSKKSKREFLMLPTVEHIDRSNPNLDFAIVSWKVNDAKNDLSLEEFFKLCQKVLNNQKEIKEKISVLAKEKIIK